MFVRKYQIFSIFLTYTNFMEFLYDESTSLNMQSTHTHTHTYYCLVVNFIFLAMYVQCLIYIKNIEKKRF